MARDLSSDGAEGPTRSALRPASAAAPLAVLVTTLAVGLAAACGRSALLDSQRLESSIPAALVPDAPEAVRDVECPDPIVEGPATFTCQASIGGQPIEVRVTVSADDEAAVSTDAVVMGVDDMEAAAAERLSADLGVETTVACPGERVVVSIVGLVLRCDAVDAAGAAHPVSLTVRSEDGDWELAIGEAFG